MPLPDATSSDRGRLRQQRLDGSFDASRLRVAGMGLADEPVADAPLLVDPVEARLDLVAQCIPVEDVVAGITAERTLV